MESTVRFWNTVGKSRLVGSAVRVGERQFSRAARQGRPLPADVLHIPLPAVYVSPELASLGAPPLAPARMPPWCFSGALVDHLTDAELLFVIGHECGHIHNNHVVYLTALYYLTQTANVILRLGAQPVVLALRAWCRRAEITSDRAGLLCTRDLGMATAALIKLALGSRKLYGEINVDEYLRQFTQGRDDLRPPGRGLFHPSLSAHAVAALRLFAQTAYFRGVASDGHDSGAGGLSARNATPRLPNLLAVFKLSDVLSPGRAQGRPYVRCSGRLADLAATAGLESTAHDIRQVRIPSWTRDASLSGAGRVQSRQVDLDQCPARLDRSLATGASPAQPATEPLLPVGITPTTAVLALIRHGERVVAEAVFEDGRRHTIDQSKLEDWLTVAGAQAMNESLSHVEIEHPARFPARVDHSGRHAGRERLNEQRADINLWLYVPRADAALFLLDATQILTASERRFIEERILRSCRDRLVFVVSKADLLNDAELEEATQFARQHLSGMVSAPAVFPISAKRALAGDGGRARACSRCWRICA